MDLTLIFPLLLLVLFVPLFLQARKQRKQMNEQQSLQSSLTEGDVVITDAVGRADRTEWKRQKAQAGGATKAFF